MAHIFTSARLTYRAPTPEDTPFLTLLKSNPASQINITNALLKPSPPTAGTTHADYLLNAALLGVVICLAPPEPSATPTPIGTASLHPVEITQSHHRTTEIGIGLLPQYQGQGYGGEAVNWLLDWGFRFAGLHRVGIAMFSYNDGARRLYEKLGFTTEGRKRECVWFDGGWHDVIEMGMLESEWRALREKGK